MTGVKETVYTPIAANVATYARLSRVYQALHDAFGIAGASGSLAGVMKELISIRREARQAKAKSHA